MLNLKILNKLNQGIKMVQPKSYKLKCQKCGYSKTVHPQSDALNPTDMLSICPKCQVKMDREELSGISKLFADSSSI